MKKISIIIPSYNDGNKVKKLVNQLIRKKIASSEIIVVESGNSNYKTSLLREIIFLKSEKGRAVQMNAGASKSTGKILVFLHADSDVSEIDFLALQKSFGMKNFGCFKIKFKSRRKYFRFIEFTSNLRKKIFGIPLGDQGLVVSKKLFGKAGGFSKGGFEDIDMALQLMKFSKVEIIDQAIKTSPRRFLKHGIAKTHFIMGLIFLFYFSGLRKISYNLYKMIK